MCNNGGAGLGRVEANQVFAVRQVCVNYLANWKDVFWAFIILIIIIII